MKKWVCLFVLPVLLSCVGSRPFAGKKTLFQYGVIDGLLAGAMDGNLTIGELKKHGDFGIGTFNSADGEMLALGETVYRIRYNGQIQTVPDTDSTPFAAVTHFIPDTSFLVQALDYASLQKQLAGWLNPNAAYAIKVEGLFDSITARAVAPGTKPYPTLKELIERSQRLFHYGALSATAIGFVSPDYLGRVNVTGYHMHFINNDLSKGGHVFGFTIREAKVYIMELENLVVQENTNASFRNLRQRKDRSEELKKIE